MYCLEYSRKQNAYHIDLLYKTAEMNLVNLIRGKSNDYQIIYLGTYDQCNDAYKKLIQYKDNPELYGVLMELNIQPSKD